MSNVELFRVILLGYANNKGEYYVEQDFAALFKIDITQAKQMFKDTPTTLKENLNAEEADQYKASIEKVGGKVEVENMKHNFSSLELL